MIESRLETANAVLQTFARGARLECRRNGVHVSWPTGDGRTSRHWQTRNNDFYPVWSRKWPDGGTAMVALSQLVRWVRGKPVFGLATWRYWASDTVLLVRDRAAIDLLREAGIPETPDCVLCGKPCQGLDWWSLDGVSGPSCHYTRGCRQKGKAARDDVDETISRAGGL